jgi:hypothetical protein
VLRIGGHAGQLDRIASNVDSVPRGIALVGGVRPLQEVGHVIQNAVFSEGQVFLENLVLFVVLGKIDPDLRLQARVDVLRQLESRSIIVHGGDQPEIRMRLDFNSRHDGFHIAPVIEQRREAGPAFLAHAVAFVDDGDAAGDHRCHQRRRYVTQVSRAFDHGCDQQVLRACVHGRLQNVHIPAHAFRRRVGQRGLTDPRLAEQPRIHGQVPLVQDHPRGQELPHQFLLTDPAHGQLVGMRQVQGHAFDVDSHNFPRISR